VLTTSLKISFKANQCSKRYQIHAMIGCKKLTAEIRKKSAKSPESGSNELIARKP